MSDTDLSNDDNGTMDCDNGANGIVFALNSATDDGNNDEFSESVDDKDEEYDMLKDALISMAAAYLAEELLAKESEQQKWGGSSCGKAPNMERNFQEAHDRLVLQYFNGAKSLYDEKDFERRFGVPRVVFDKVRDELDRKIEPFMEKRCTWEKGISPLCWIVACWRILVYGFASDAIDEYLQISKSTINHTFKVFCTAMVEVFSEHYLNQYPSMDEKERAMKIMKQCGFPGGFASWDCKHFNWKNCPVRIAGQRCN